MTALKQRLAWSPIHISIGSCLCLCLAFQACTQGIVKHENSDIRGIGEETNLTMLANENTRKLMHPYSKTSHPILQQVGNPEWDYTQGPPQSCLALSGGGIRSAAYAMGVLKAMSEADGNSKFALDSLDILSAVSGGSYAASWYMVQR